ncbi:malonyl CoA-acyl carrier protein transacylase [Janthinobacterium sp. HH103]|uniref:ACP S-malonyltransferase n=1 Tax=unclassified Janthinobacterium TaxID=2610881 RepID=UPI0008740C93|nr:MULTISPECIES: ACP S-malonyltransferase [unclassified Janthinobacterium]MCC7599039.1 ACP S-malonyltransferase [Janthinobacterium sp. FW305-129]MCC7682300.1 ACP S-malonyltransferase [Janthinobacterium sp. FW305-128]OEZ59399.1 malonyl CoA-acyl carrier protein transacylase [Janthinobacterium sp. HH100]OEZ68726.1 malonyl CoA-acyl carrier protein transacylase [Janthinobacterium sp. HH103]OEZ92302.1 malonyl CoA-acyl carrier protein transacylase [Janthinobacterium sp. HH106]
MTQFAFVFPGQGSQAIAMLDGFAGNPVVAQTVAEASDALQCDLGKLIAEGPKEELDLTTNTQPVMLTAAVAFYRAWLAAGGPVPTVVAGHSLGEYSALVAAGVISFKDAVPLVRFRAQAMQEAVPVGQGTMAVVLGLSDDDVRAACAEAAAENPALVVEPVNFNAPAQVVIAGHTAAVERACELAKAKGAKRAMKLPVSAPFHSSLLKPASDRLREYMAGLTFAAPQIALINNVDVAIVNDVAGIKDALVRQAASPVRWVETMQKVAADGITQVIECGPGKVLMGLAKRIDPVLVGDAIVDQASLERILTQLK